jgi:hypothetical protein
MTFLKTFEGRFGQDRTRWRVPEESRARCGEQFITSSGVGQRFQNGQWLLTKGPKSLWKPTGSGSFAGRTQDERGAPNVAGRWTWWG